MSVRIAVASLSLGLFVVFSCTTVKSEAPLLATKEGMTYEIRIFDVPVSANSGHQQTEILSPEQALKLIKEFTQEPLFSATFSAPFGKARSVNNEKDFVYVTEWKPPQLSPSGTQGFPVTPATPSSFETTRVGTRVRLKGLEANEGLIDLDLEISRRIFLGFTNYGKPITAEAEDFFGRKVPVVVSENKIEKANFRSDRLKASAILKEGSYLVVRNVGATPVNPGGFPYAEERPPGLIALIRAVGR